MNKKYFLVLGSIAIFTLLIVNYTEGALPPPSAEFNFGIDKDFVKKGDWRLNFVAIPNYGLTGLDNAKNYFSNLQKEYIRIKEICGLSSDFKYTVLGEKHGELSATRSKCEPYYKYVGDPWSEHTISFHNFHYVYLVENKPSSKNVIFNYPIECELSNGNCQIVVGQEYDSRNPHFIVLEKLNSNEDVYFSGAITIPWDYLQKVRWKIWGSEPRRIYPLELTAFEIKKPNQLIIQFKGAEKGAEEIKNLNEISKLLVDQKQLVSIQDIQLKHEEERPTYEIAGVRKVKLLFLIPISLKIKLEVNAMTGQIITIKKPWWSFLVF